MTPASNHGRECGSVTITDDPRFVVLTRPQRVRGFTAMNARRLPLADQMAATRAKRAQAVARIVGGGR